MIDLASRLERHPRVRLGHSPTPIDAAPALGEHLGLDLYIKRDDCTGLGMGGNKVRQIEFYLGEARAQGADSDGDDGVTREPDERLMRSVEEKTEIPEARKDDFRHELMNYIAAVHLEGGQFDYRENRRLRRALELKLFEDQKDSIQLTSLVSSVVDRDTGEKIAVIRDRLCRRFGYDEASADVVLRDVAGLFVRSEEETARAAAAGDGDDEAAA